MLPPREVKYLWFKHSRRLDHQRCCFIPWHVRMDQTVFKFLFIGKCVCVCVCVCVGVCGCVFECVRVWMNECLSGRGCKCLSLSEILRVWCDMFLWMNEREKWEGDEFGMRLNWIRSLWESDAMAFTLWCFFEEKLKWSQTDNIPLKHRCKLKLAIGNTTRSAPWHC